MGKFIFLVFVVFASVAKSESYDPFFSPSEIAELQGEIDKLREKQLDLFGCSDNETHAECVARNCKIDLSFVKEGDFDGFWSGLLKLRDEEIKCLSTGTEFGEESGLVIIGLKHLIEDGLFTASETRGIGINHGDSPSQSIFDDIKEELSDGAYRGLPLVEGEKVLFREAISKCWIVDRVTPAAEVAVTITFNLTEDGKVIGESLELVSSTSGDENAVFQAFQAARRAILRCQKDGYDLPREKYQEWQKIEITFDPTGFKLR